VVFRRVDVVLLGILATPVSVAYYEVAAKIPDALQRLSESYFAVYYPTMAGLLGDGKRAEARAFLNQSLRLFSFAGALIALTAVVWSREIVTLVFSANYAPSAATFAILMIVFHMTLLVNLFGYTLTSAGFPGRSLTKNVARTAINVVGDLLLIPLFGFMGPALATLVAVYAANPFGAWLLRRSQIAIEMTPYVTQTLLLLGCAALAWWALPALWISKIGVLLAFVLLNLLFATVSVRDLWLIAPQRRPRPAPLPQETLS
jgi:O-antigen/teichoic acid export membrane protein